MLGRLLCKVIYNKRHTNRKQYKVCMGKGIWNTEILDPGKKTKKTEKTEIRLKVWLKTVWKFLG